LDRFMLRLKLGYPNLRGEIEVLDRQQFRHPVETLEPVVSVAALLEAQEAVKHIHISPAVKEYIVRLVDRTRRHEDVYLGASPRGSLNLYRTGQVWAAIHGRDYVLPDDVKMLADPVLAHRLILNPGARLRNISQSDILKEILEKLPVPEGDLAGEA